MFQRSLHGPPVLQAWDFQHKLFALKGREADLVKLAPIAAPNLTVRNLEVLQLDLLSAG